jgi:prenyltransferase beta subunit
MDVRIVESIREAANWLVSVRKGGQFSDLVYKKQGIINTCEAWHTLAMAKQVLPDLTRPLNLFSDDSDYLAKAIKQHGFLRTPYQPDKQRQEITDVAAFVILTLADTDKTKGKPLIERAVKWLLKNQAPDGGWSWGRVDKKHPSYPYFTYMAMAALACASKQEDFAFAAKLKPAISKGVQWLYSIQRPDGSFPVYDGDDTSDVASTAYALLGMLFSRTNKAAVKNAAEYLLSLSYTDLTKVGNLKIVEPQKPPQLWVNYENYAVPADVLLALVKALPDVPHMPQIHERIQFLVQYLLEQKEAKAGWPKTYSTIYVTRTCVEALASYLQYLQSYPQIRTARKGIAYNPYIFGFPIHNPKMFFGRESIIQRIRDDLHIATNAKRDLALIGERRIGKTSLLLNLPFYLKQDGHIVIYLNLELMQTNEQFFFSFIKLLGKEIFAKSKHKLSGLFLRAFHQLDRKLFRKLDIELQTPFLTVFTNTKPRDLYAAFLSDVDSLMKRQSKYKRDGKVVFMLDEIAHLNEPKLYSLLRGIAQKYSDLVFIIAGTDKAWGMINNATSPFYNIFNPIPLGELDLDAAKKLICEPVKNQVSYTQDAISAILKASKLSPYDIQGICYHCLRLLEPSSRQIDQNTAKQAIELFLKNRDWK